jgi:hypothetical protein
MSEQNALSTRFPRLNRQMWFAHRLRRPDLFARGVTTDEERTDLIRQLILALKLADSPAARGVSFRQAFARAFGRDLEPTT